MAECSAERVPGAEAVYHVDGHRRHLDRHAAVVREHALRALLDYREVGAELMQCLRGGQRLPLTHRGITLIEVADRDAHVRQRLLYPVAGVLAAMARTAPGNPGRGP